MILGMSLETFTELHTIISLVAIAARLVVLFGMFGSHEWRAWTAFFLVMTFLTSATGFLFPRAGFTPAQGVVSIVIFVVLGILAGIKFRPTGAIGFARS
jgi:hypothetical protein